MSSDESKACKVEAAFENVNMDEEELYMSQRPFTKNQMRKWNKKEKWEARKNEKRAREKAKAKKKRIEAKLNNIDIGPSRKALKHCKVANSSCTSGVVVDLSFDHLMIEKDRFKVIKQILRCYSLNRRSPTPMKFYITSFNGRVKREMSRHNGYEYWDVVFEERNYIDAFPKEKLIYLSSESENVITSIEPDKLYIVGGLVDHNFHKGLCHKIANEQGIQHGRLPLDVYLDMKTRRVLTIDHVFEILLRVAEGKSWPEVLMKVVPMRKGAKVTRTGDEGEEESEGDEDQEMEEGDSSADEGENILKEDGQESNAVDVNCDDEINTDGKQNNTDDVRRQKENNTSDVKCGDEIKTDSQDSKIIEVNCDGEIKTDSKQIYTSEVECDVEMKTDCQENNILDVKCDGEINTNGKQNNTDDVRTQKESNTSDVKCGDEIKTDGKQNNTNEVDMKTDGQENNTVDVKCDDELKK